MNKKEELDAILEIIKKSLNTLLINDKDIFSNETKVLEINNIQTGETGNRKLHETAINHRFAYYLENNLDAIPAWKGYYQIDIEYNRYFGKPKENNGDLIRPDVVIHKRRGDNLTKDNLLLVEAKKDIISEIDEKKVWSIMSNGKYNFKYGLTVTYCAEGDTKIKYKLFTWENGFNNPMCLEIDKNVNS